MSVSVPVPQRLLVSVDESPVMAYVKDLDGHYLHVNQRYQEFFEVAADEIRGRADDELEPRQTVDGPRRASGSVSEDEPLQLEYTVAPFDGRPALAVWRFAARSADSDAVAICGVAAPVAEAALARRECDRLIAIAQELKQAEPPVIEEVDEAQTDDRTVAALHEASASATRRAHELQSELTAERERRAEAETRAAEAGELRRRVEAAETAAITERTRAEESLADLNAMRAELASLRGRFEGADATVQREVARAEEAEAAAQRERVRIEETLAELNAVRGELASVRGRIEGVEAAAQREMARTEEADAAAQHERSRAEGALAELNQVRRELDASRAELASDREQQTHSKKKIVEDLRRQLADAVEEMEEERTRAEAFSAELNEAREELAAVRTGFESEREQRVQSEQVLVEDLRRQLADAVADLNSTSVQLEAAHAGLTAEREQRSHSDQELVDHLRRQLEAAETAAQSERARAEASLAEFDAARVELDTARAELASEREQRTHSDQDVVDDLRRQLAEAREAAEAERVRVEEDDARVQAEHSRAEQQILDDLRHMLDHATATARHEKARADGAEVALNSERADAEIRVGVAERRIAELEAALSDARAHQLEVETEHGTAGPCWDSSAQRAFTTALSQSSDWRVSVKSAIGVIGSQGGWDAVCAWQPDDRNGFASCFAMWTGKNQRLGALETATWQRRQPLTESTIGQALSWEESQWLAADPRAADRRLQLLAQHGIRGALIVPVRDGARPVAALELLTVGATEPNRELVHAIETMALQLGHFSHLLSAGAQPRWRFGHV